MAVVYKMTNALSDKVFMARSLLFTEPDDGTYAIIQIPNKAFISDVWLNITTAYVAGTPSLTIGWMGNGETAQTAGFMSNDIAKPMEVGLKRAQHDTLLAWEGKYFNAGTGAVTITVAANSATTEGVFQVFVQYTVIY